MKSKREKSFLENRMLSREQMRDVLGGFGNCIADCLDGTYVWCHGDSCTATDGVGCTDGAGGSCSCDPPPVF